MPERLEFRYSPRGQISLMIVSCVVAGASWYLAATTADVVYRTAGWLGVGFFALCTLIAAKRLLAGGVPFVFNLAGIAFPTGSFGLLPWTEIKAYAVVTVRGNYFLAFTFHNPDRVLSRVSAAKRRWAFANQRLGEAVAFIREHSLLQPAA
jgi:hypothetical protein